MPARHQITCTTKDGPDPDYRIDRIGGSTGAPNGGPWKIGIDQAIRGIIDGTWTFFVNVAGREVDVLVKQHPQSGRFYLTTEADGFPPNNLLKLPNCP